MNVSRALIVVLAVTWAFAGPASAQALDAATSEALAATLRVLQDPAQLTAVIAGNPQAAGADRQMQAMLGTPELQQEFYGLVAAVFTEVVQRAGGDAGKMTQALAAGQSDPAGFLATLSPGTAERLRALAAKVAEQKR
jgi:hypothetical protein